MQFEYTLDFDLSVDEAWAKIMDLEQIAPCMPGAKIESREGDTYSGRLKVKLGPMEMTYRGKINFIEKDDQNKHAVVDATAKEIKGRGEAKTQVKLDGVATATGSAIKLVSEFSVSGKAAQFGRGVMEEVGEKLMDDFATRLGKQISADAAAAPVAATNAPASPPPAAEIPTNAPGPDAASTDTHSTSSQTTATETEALDLGEAAFTPVMRRLGVGIAIVAVGALAYFLL